LDTATETEIPPSDGSLNASWLIHVTGWASDWDTSAPIQVAFRTDDHLTKTTKWVSPVLADQPRPDIDAAFHRGANFGFDTSINLGTPVLASLSSETAYVTVCAVALNVGPGDNTILGCRDVEPFAPPPGTSHNPSGILDSATLTFTDPPLPTPEIHLTGWASDWDITAPIKVAFWTEDPATVPYITPQWQETVLADQPRPDVDAAFHRGANFGFDTTVTYGDPGLFPAYETVCVVALNVGPGDNTILGCRDVRPGVPG
jgi:hypothetical protein